MKRGERACSCHDGEVESVARSDEWESGSIYVLTLTVCTVLTGTI